LSNTKRFILTHMSNLFMYEALSLRKKDIFIPIVLSALKGQRI